jgi:hypothetical protein
LGIQTAFYSIRYGFRQVRPIIPISPFFKHDGLEVEIGAAGSVRMGDKNEAAGAASAAAVAGEESGLSGAEWM